ncbi:adenylate/guanylate cyclase domain-containing protein [Spongiimicrobium salis]|uniref:adenylate/guanylate cyclase domain-containing protein n=1 Tax=Spongiimicrobium salis TaxID=1667022 RepID=UPI00374CA8FF
MSQKRQLAAILFTDIEGYTSLMQKDEDQARKLRDMHREIFEAATKNFDGKIIQYFGDGTLSIYQSTVEAVYSCIEMQRAFIAKNIPVRIGLHVGDIVYSKEDIIGDAVNIASRIESCAIAGSILISDKVHDQIRSHSDIQSKFLDAYEFKNVETAMPLFAIANEGIAIPDPAKIKGKLKQLPDQTGQTSSRKKTLLPILLGIVLLGIGAMLYASYFSKKNVPLQDLSIAVLPFDNLSTDADAEIFRDGMTEDILTYLAKIKDLHVISRTSVMQYKDTKKTIPQIAKELGVSYILEGSIRKYGDKVRVTAQLIRADEDGHLWAENYDKTLTDIFSIQTEVSKEIVAALQVNLSFEEQQGLALIPTENIEAYKLFLRGKKEADKRNKASIAKSIELYKEAIVLDPDYAEAYAEIANSIYLETYYSGRNPEEAAELANTYLNKAEAITDKVSRIYSVRGLIYNIQGKQKEAKAAFEKAIQLSPNDLTARHQFSTFYYYKRDFEKQLEQAEIAYRLDPLSFATGNSYFTALTSNKKYDEAEKLMKNIEKNNTVNNTFVINRSFFRLYTDKKDYQSAIPHLEKIVGQQPVFNRFLAYCYGTMGDTIKVRQIIDTILKTVPEENKSQQLAVAYAGLKEADSVLFYLDPKRNPLSKRVTLDETLDFFEFLKDDPRYIALLKQHRQNLK